MSMEATLATWALTKKMVTQTEKLFLLMCARRAAEEHTCWPGVERMVTDTAMEKKTITKVRQSLIKKGLLRYTGEMKGVSKRTPVMQLTYVSNTPPYLKLNENDGKIDTPVIGAISEIDTPVIGVIDTPVIGAQNSKEEYKRKNISKTFSKSDMLAENPHNIAEDMIDDWIANRKLKKACAVTKRIWDYINRQLTLIVKSCCITAPDAFERMIVNEWRSLELSYFQQGSKQFKSVESKPYVDEELASSEYAWVKSPLELAIEEELRLKCELDNYNNQ